MVAPGLIRSNRFAPKSGGNGGDPSIEWNNGDLTISDFNGDARLIVASYTPDGKMLTGSDVIAVTGGLFNEATLTAFVNGVSGGNIIKAMLWEQDNPIPIAASDSFRK